MNYNGTKDDHKPQIKPIRPLIYPTGIVALSAIMLLAIIPCFIIAIKDYKILYGINGSAWTGWANFKEIAARSDIRDVTLGALKLRGMEIALGVIPGAILAQLCAHPKKRGIKAALGGLCLMPACAPYSALYAFYISCGMISSSTAPEMAYALVACPRVMGITAFVGATFAALGENHVRGALHGALVMLLLKLMAVLTPSFPATLIVGGNTLDMLIYELGIAQGEFARAMAAYWLKAAMQLPVALVSGGLLVWLLANRMRSQVRIGERDSGWMVSTLSLPLAFCAALIVLYAAGNSQGGFIDGVKGLFDASALNSVANYMYASGMTALMAAGLALILALCLRAAATGRNGKAYVLGALSFLTLAYPVTYQFLMARQFGMLNTYWGVALGAFMRSDTILPVLAICSLSFCMDMRASGRYMPALMATLFVAATVWGDAAGAQIFGVQSVNMGMEMLRGAAANYGADAFMGFWTTFPAAILCAGASGCAVHMFSGRD